MSKNLCLAVAVLILVTGPVSGQNVIAGFPQLAIGDAISSVIELTNLGTETWSGSMAILTSQGSFMSVFVNSQPVSDFYPLTIDPHEVVRLKITGIGDPLAGHVVILDNSNTVEISKHIRGNLEFQIMDAQQNLDDSVGVQMAPLIDHFFILGRFGGGARTGMAISAVNQTNFSLRAVSTDGVVVDEYQDALNQFEHTAFFADEKLTLPEGFDGIFEVFSDKEIRGVALLLNQGQLSTIPLDSVPGIYDFTIKLDSPDNREFSGQMYLSVKGTFVKGHLKFESPMPESAFVTIPISGSATGSSILIHGISQFGGKSANFLFISQTADLNAPSFEAQTWWYESSGLTFGDINATNRGRPEPMQ